jgi:signal transduction histidine kinase
MRTSRWIRTHGDALMAIAVSVLFQAQVWAGFGLSADEPDEGLGPAGRAALGLVGLAFTVSLTWRRRWPLVPLALAIPTLILSGPGGVDGTPALVLALIVATWSAGAETRDTAAIAAALGVVALLVIAVGRDPDALTSGGDALVPVLLLGGPWATGLAWRIRRDRSAAVEARAAGLERDREADARAAALDERARIARELHDVVAHAISVVVLQARGARHTLAADPAATGASLDAIETTAMEALAEMRRLFDVLDDTSRREAADLAPQPGLGDLDRLLAQVREAGLPVELVVEGEPRRLPAGVDLSAYRIVQEALTNALRHAGPAQARVLVRYGPDVPDRPPSIELEIADTGRGGSPDAMPTSAAGRGLIGMRERAALVGGVLEAGPGGGGYVVRALLPIAPARA